MLKSLFGELGAPQAPGVQPRPAGDEPPAFAATALAQTSAGEVNERGQLVDRHTRDLFVTGSPAQAMREHFAASRAELEHAGKWIVLLDPARVWASAVIKALSDAGGQPIERLHLREHGTLRTLAMIERTAIVRRLDETVKIYHADVRASGRENAEISLALMERAQLTAVIVGPMQPHAIDAMLTTLQEAAKQPTWRCPNLLFLLPPGAVWIANKIENLPWPDGLKLETLTEPLTGASMVWNAVLGVWAKVKDGRGPWASKPLPPVAPPAEVELISLPIDDPAPADEHDDDATVVQPRPSVVPAGVLEPDSPPIRSGTMLDTERAARALARMVAHTDGLLACALVDSASGLVLAHEQLDTTGLDIELAAASCAQAMRAQRLAAKSIGLHDAVDELIVGAGHRQLVLRVLTRHPQMFMFALLDKHRTNLALARLRLFEAEKAFS